jgi:putative two-component system response regulator
MIDNKHVVLIVDDISDNVEILDEILNHKYIVKIAKNGERALEIAQKIKPDIILLDIIMPKMDGYEVCRRLKMNPDTSKIQVIFVTAKGEDIDEANGFEIGAVDFITKPIKEAIVLARVKTHIALYNQNMELERKVLERTRELAETRFEIIKRLAIAAEYKDIDTGMHIFRIGNYCKIIGLNYGLNESDADLLREVSSMHDVGKIGIPDSILQKPGKLDGFEFETVKTHCDIGVKIIGEHDSVLLKMAKIIAKEHHEKWNGTGYPDKLSGVDIHLFARIVAVADVFDALTTKRPYKEPWPLKDAIQLIRSEAGKHFDPAIVNAFDKGIADIIRIKEAWCKE